ncbi:histone deacetylase family protein [Roseicitreum antarcticum]|uniref:Acetoin utilization deacetylase AcuC n=1 Tax=Roseicitreum antarcticum TaxID=564137 RepID=A0A1H3C9C5_9RHOB|nr:histone deacetylase family protein [Roseicitreum antarcticum]SDX50119.1 Acetoin utilization deacetylase AcuC [Roseicitreum antarcticum]
MKSVYSPRHHGQSGQYELVSGAIVPAFEKPERAEFIRARLAEVALGPVLPPETHSLDIARKVHDAAYLSFLETAYDQWLARGNTGPALPFIWPRPGLRSDVPPADIEGLLGHYSFDGGAPFVAGTWDAVKSSHDVALTGAALLARDRAAFALCRPPGHHAGRAFAGGYCFINNAAVAAQALRDAGHARVAVLDVDYHHGNGTQEIFYDQRDVLVVNIHADPRHEFPYFLGHADERGAGDGVGANLNLPLPLGTEWPAWHAALDSACTAVADFGPTALVISLGTDTFIGDPISQFRLTSAHFPQIGARIAALGLPTLFVMEGGYAVAEIGVNAVGVLEGFDAAI